MAWGCPSSRRRQPGGPAEAPPPQTLLRLFLSAALGILEDEGASLSQITAVLLRHSRLLSVMAPQQLRMPSPQGRGRRRPRCPPKRPMKAGSHLRDSANAHARSASAERARLAAAATAQRWCQTLRLRSGRAGREGGRWRRWRRRLLLKRRRGSGGRCFCQFRLFVREVDPPLPEQPGGSCGSRGQHRPRPPARPSPARHGPGLRPPLQAAHHRRQR